MHSLKLRRRPDFDNGLHPEIRSIQAANRVTERFRRRGLEGPSVDGEKVVQQLEQSLERRGLLPKRESSGGPDTESRRASATAGIIPAETPRTPDSMGVGQDGTDVSYFAEVMFGSENKTFILIIDTGSSDTWIPSSKCTSEACKVHSTFGSEDSDTLKITQKTFDIKYAGGDVMGTVVTDSVKFAGFELLLSFGLASEVSDDFVNFPIDGILGLGFGDGSQQKVPTIMDELVDKGLIKSKLFGVALSRHGDEVNDGVINFGGIDSGLFEGDLTFTPSVSDQGLWELELDDFSVNGNALQLSGKTAIIDTGSSLVFVPPKDAMRIHSLIPGAEASGETFSIPCNSDATLEFTFSGVTYKVQPIDYIGVEVVEKESMCLSLILSRQIMDKDTWILGDLFLKNVYSVFDLENKRIGLAPRRKRDDGSTSASETGSTSLINAPAPTTTGSSSNSNASPAGDATPFGSSAPPALTSPSFLIFLASPFVLAITAVFL